MAKILGACFLATALACGSAAMAQEKKAGVDKALEGIGEFSASVTGTTDYVFRGFTQTKEGPAIQGSFDWSKEFQAGDRKYTVFLGAWASNVDFQDGDQAHIEIDYSGGIRTEFGKLSFEAIAIYYNYPNTRDSLNYDYIEAGAAVGYDFDVVEAAVQVLWSPDFFGGIGDAIYVAGDFTVPLPEKFSLGAHVGYSAFDDSSATDYTDWSISISRPLLGVDLSLAYIDTDVDDCANVCDARAVFTISKSF